MNINLELYKTFYYVAKNESISRAAKEMLISQPAISKSIKTLEEQINTELFIRKRDGVELTTAGKILYKKVKNALELINLGESEVSSLANINMGSISIGASKSIINHYLLPYIINFHNKYPNINIKIYTDKTSDLISKAKTGLIDIVFTNTPIKVINDYEIYNIMELHDILVTNNKEKNKSIKVKDLETLPLLLLNKGTTPRNSFDNYCEKNNIHVTPIMEFGSNTLIKEFVKAGFGIGLLTEEYIKEDLKNKTLYKLNIDVPFDKKYLSMITNKYSTNIASKEFIKYIKEDID